MEDRIRQIHKAIENGANLIYRDGAFWPGPLEVWDLPPHKPMFLAMKEIEHERVPLTESGDSRD